MCTYHQRWKIKQVRHFHIWLWHAIPYLRTATKHGVHTRRFSQLKIQDKNLSVTTAIVSRWKGSRPLQGQASWSTVTHNHNSCAPVCVCGAGTINVCVREEDKRVVMMKWVLEHTVQDMTDNFLTSAVMVDLTASKIPILDKSVYLAERAWNLSKAMRGEYGLYACVRHDTYIISHIIMPSIEQLRSLSICWGKLL